MKGVIIACLLLLEMGEGQPNPPLSLQPTPLEAFAHMPATHIAWSKEVGRIDSREAHAVVTALILEDTAQPPDRMRGIRIHLSAKDFEDTVYLGEETLGAYKKALDEIATEAAQERSKGTTRDNLTRQGTSYVGTDVFWYATKAPRVHSLNAAYYFAADSSGLYLSAFQPKGFRFPDEDPSKLSLAICRAMEQLRNN